MARLYIFPKKVTQFYTIAQMNHVKQVIDNQLEQLQTDIDALPTDIKDVRRMLDSIIDKKNIIANNWWIHQIYLDNNNRIEELRKLRQRIEAQFRERAYEYIKQNSHENNISEEQVQSIVNKLRIAQDWNPEKSVNKKIAFAWQLKGELSEQIFIKLSEKEAWRACVETIQQLKRDLTSLREVSQIIDRNIIRSERMPYVTRQQIKSLNYDIDVLRDTIDLLRDKLNTGCSRLIELMKYTYEFSQIDSRGNRSDMLMFKNSSLERHLYLITDDS